MSENGSRASGDGPAGEHRSGDTATEVPVHRLCLQCGFEVPPKAWGCKNPCRNCGFVYPLGDCSD